MKTVEEKARAYDKALERAKDNYNAADSANINVSSFKNTLIALFPELAKSEDEKIRENIIRILKGELSYTSKEDADRYVTWLEKQGSVDKASYEIAEKEKYDFVSGQFLYCKGSFNEFKEGESYWLEYVGNDNYTGRSDNVLNQKFHITPRQLYTWLDPRHDYGQCENNNDKNNAPTAYGKYVDECLDEAAKHFFSEGEDKYSVADLFYAGVRCGKSWLEKQKSVTCSTVDSGNDEKIRKLLIRLFSSNNQNEKFDNISTQEIIAWLEKQESNLVKNGYTNNKDFIRYADNYSHEIWHKLMDNFKNIKDYHIGCNDVSDIVLNAIIDTCNWLEKQGDSNNQSWKPSKEQIHALEFFVRSIAESGYASPYSNNTKLLFSLLHDLEKLETSGEQKFKVGDWIVSTLEGYYKVLAIEKEHSTEKYSYTLLEPSGNETAYSKEFVDEHFHLWTDQDVKNGSVLVGSYGTFIFTGESGSYCGVLRNNTFIRSTGNNEWTEDLHPATKKQRDILFQKMKEAGYEWDDEDKKLKKINSYCQENCKGYQETGKCFADGGCDAKHKAEQELTTLSNKDEDYGIDGLWHAKRILEKTLGNVDGYQSDDGILSHKCAIAAVNRLCEQKPSWSEDDERMLHTIIADFKGFIRCNTSTLESHFNECIAYLKSLKERLVK